MKIKRPSFQFYPSDWLRDTALRSCSISARGLWMDMLCYMHEGSTYGHLKVNEKVIDSITLSRMVGMTKDECDQLLSELESCGVFKRTEDGVIFSKRMVSDETLREARSNGGKLGGNPDLGVNYNSAGFVYVMKRASGHIKIGISQHPEKRAYRIRKSIGDDSVFVLSKKYVSNMGLEESILHKKYEKYNIGGEWFNMPDSEIESLVNLMGNHGVHLKENQTPSSSTSSSSSSSITEKKTTTAVQPFTVDDQVWNDFLAVRKAKRAPLTETALSMIEKESELAGLTLNDALTECVTRGWQSFKADWIKPKQQQAEMTYSRAC
jgi:hypothetical protein